MLENENYKYLVLIIFERIEIAIIAEAHLPNIRDTGSTFGTRFFKI
jgi:hypothetical protein